MKSFREKIITFDNWDNILARFLIGDYVIIKAKRTRNFFMTVKLGNNDNEKTLDRINKWYQFVFPDNINEIIMELPDVDYVLWNRECVHITEFKISLDLFINKYANYKRTNNYKRQIGSIKS